MPSVNHHANVPRQRAEWMRPTDDAILEYLRSYGNLTPKALSNLDVCTRGHASIRLNTLREVGFVEYVADTEGLFKITERGEDYLDEDFDASTVQPDDSQ